MNINELYPSRFLNASDLHGQPLRVVIAGLKREDVGGTPKNILSFSGDTKSLILNKTNAKAIAKALGCDDTREWRAKAILLVPAVTDYKGDTVDCVRVRSAPQQSKDESPLDDFIPEL